MGKYRIRLQNISKFYYSETSVTQALRKIDLNFSMNEFVAITGESGSGKSTLLKIISGIEGFDEGELFIDGRPTSQYDDDDWERYRREKIGYIFQDYSLISHYSARDNIVSALLIMGLTHQEAVQKADHYLERVGLKGMERQTASKLSSGQKQRLSIARALSKGTDIIVADEPTGNLDEENTIRTMSILKNISKECLVILVSHERRIVEFFADRIIEIKDGRIIKDQDNVVRGNYQKADDANIYLRELEKFTLENEQGHFNLYRNTDSEDPQIRLNLVWKDGKLYVQNLMEEDVVLAGEETGCQMLDREKPELDLSDVDDFIFDLERLPAKKSGNLPFREIWRMAIENIRLMGKKQVFVVIIMLAAAILLTIALADLSNVVLLDKTQIVEDDSHYAVFRFRRQSYYEQQEVKTEVASIYDRYLANSPFADAIFVEPDDPLSVPLKGYVQMRSFSGGLDQFSYVSSEHLQEQDLIYGKMPEKYKDVVVDRLVLERFMKSNGNLSNLYHSVEEFVGKSLLADVYNQNMHIVGVCDTQEMALYCGQNILYSFSMTAQKVASVSDLQKEYPGKYDDLVLKDDELLVQERNRLSTVWENGERLPAKTYLLYDETYNITGTLPEDCKFDCVISDHSCAALQRRYVISNNRCSIYLKDPEKELPRLQKLVDEINGDETMEAIEVKLSMPYQDQMDDYKKARKAGVDSKKVFSLVILILSLIMIYFTVKSNVISRSEELTVYRLLGIGKGSILRAYLLEMVLINTFTSLPAILLTSIVLKLVSSIPSLEMQLLFPWWMILLLIAAFYLVNMIVSILPVNRILSKPPAKLALKG